MERLDGLCLWKPRRADDGRRPDPGLADGALPSRSVSWELVNLAAADGLPSIGPEPSSREANEATSSPPVSSSSTDAPSDPAASASEAADCHRD